MRLRVRLLVWFESCLAIVSAILAVVTAVWPTWIEGLFEVDPDRGTGATEWWLVVVLVVAALVLTAIARWQQCRSSKLSNRSADVQRMRRTS
jgi:hypothetical protein